MLTVEFPSMQKARAESTSRYAQRSPGEHTGACCTHDSVYPYQLERPCDTSRSIHTQPLHPDRDLDRPPSCYVAKDVDLLAHRHVELGSESDIMRLL